MKLANSQTILNVDDNEPGLYAKSRILRHAGFEVLEASDGETALRLAATASPQLVLLDVRLPDISGLEVCRRIKSDPATRRLPVLHISATKRLGFGPLWKAIAEAHASALKKLPTPVLTRLLHEAVEHQAPQRAGAFRPKLRYAHQGGMNPPVVVIHGNSVEHVTDAYRRYLEGRIRAHFKLVGTPLRIELRSSRNPYKDKES